MPLPMDVLGVMKGGSKTLPYGCRMRYIVGAGHCLAPYRKSSKYVIASQCSHWRGNLLVASIDLLCRNKHRTGRFPGGELTRRGKRGHPGVRRPFWPPRNDNVGRCCKKKGGSRPSPTSSIRSNASAGLPDHGRDELRREPSRGRCRWMCCFATQGSYLPIKYNTSLNIFEAFLKHFLNIFWSSLVPLWYYPELVK